MPPGMEDSFSSPAAPQLWGLKGEEIGHSWRKLALAGGKCQPIPVFLPGESQGRGSLVGCCLWGCTESDTTEATYQQQG